MAASSLASDGANRYTRRRASWYSASASERSTPTVPTAATIASRAIQRSLIPLVTTVTRAITRYTSMVPRSGWSSNSPIGAAASTRASPTRHRPAPPARGDNSSASPTITTSFPGSDGCILNVPRENQPRVPLTSTPTCSTSHSAAIIAAKPSG